MACLTDEELVHSMAFGILMNFRRNECQIASEGGNIFISDNGRVLTLKSDGTWTITEQE